MFKLGYTSALKYAPDLDGSKGQHCLKSPDLLEINGKLFYLACKRVKSGARVQCVSVEMYI